MPHKDPAVAKEYYRKKYLENREKILAQTKARYDENPEKYKAYQHEYYKKNKEMIVERERGHRETNKEALNLRSRIYHKKNKEACNERSRNYGIRNAEKIKEKRKKYCAKNKEKMAEWKKRYYQENKERINRKSYPNVVKRRADKLKRTPAWADLEAIEDVYIEARYFQLHVDHIVPLRGKLVSGLHVWENLQLLTKKENQSKNNKFNPATFDNNFDGEVLCQSLI